MSRSHGSSSGAYCAMNHSRSFSGCGGIGARFAGPVGLRPRGVRAERGEAPRELIVGGAAGVRPSAPDSARGAGPDRCRCAVRATAPHRAPTPRARSPCSSIAMPIWRACAAACSTMCSPTWSWLRRNSMLLRREVRVTEHVRGDQHVLRGAVALREIGAARDCPGTRLRTVATGPCGAGSADRCSARRTTSAACAPADRRSRSRS